MLSLNFSYDRVLKENQRLEYLDLLDYTVNAITLGIQADARRQVCAAKFYISNIDSIKDDLVDFFRSHQWLSSCGVSIQRSGLEERLVDQNQLCQKANQTVIVLFLLNWGLAILYMTTMHI